LEEEKDADFVMISKDFKIEKAKSAIDKITKSESPSSKGKRKFIPAHSLKNLEKAVHEDKENEGVKNYSKKFNCQIWMSHEFPIQIQKIQTVFETLAHGNEAVSKLQEFLKDNKIQDFFVQNGFPVKIQVPVGYSIQAVVTFEKFQPFPEAASGVFDIPTDYSLVKRKDGMKMMKSRKKRLVMAKFNL